MIDLNQFIEWIMENPSRRLVDIKIHDGNAEIWVFDSVIGEGQFVKSVDEIDLIGKKTKKEQTELKRLLAKYREDDMNNVH